MTHLALKALCYVIVVCAPSMGLNTHCLSVCLSVCSLQFDAPAEAVARKPSGSEAPSYEGKIRSTTSKKAEKARRRRGLEREKDAGVGTGGGAALGKEDTSAVQSRSSQVCHFF